MLRFVDRQPTSVADRSVVSLAFQFATQVRQQFAARMADERWAADVNLRRGCFGVLRVIERASTPLSQREVSARVGIDASDVVDLVDRLERAGFVRRQRDERDRRRNVLELTTAGRRAIERFEKVAIAVDEIVLRDLDDDEQATLRRLLQTVVTSREPKR